MMDNQFDAFFRKKLEDYSSQVPGDMWRRIKQRKDKERRIIIFLALLLLTAGGATSYFVFSGSQQNKGNIASSQKNTVENSDYLFNKQDETISQKDITSEKGKNKNSLTDSNITVKD